MLADCLDILLEAFPDDPAMQKAIIADNPARLYDVPDWRPVRRGTQKVPGVIPVRPPSSVTTLPLT